MTFKSPALFSKPVNVFKILMHKVFITITNIIKIFKLFQLASVTMPKGLPGMKQLSQNKSDVLLFAFGWLVATIYSRICDAFVYLCFIITAATMLFLIAQFFLKKETGNTRVKK